MSEGMVESDYYSLFCKLHGIDNRKGLDCSNFELKTESTVSTRIFVDQSQK